ncbi:hypothetical protein [Oxynema aestuarii]|uniref:Gas vesicle protein GvpC n=1 Tax=Oxynema aestuarii AP17 TaxID=2064643 RepID=A0A6H1TRD0_9CYAN|nr:hypothetical protein [Oxynema aestuarii]QIZ69152.1 hypothetical protein HCG48_04215 [Oxynema aestuarii AP17]
MALVDRWNTLKWDREQQIQHRQREVQAMLDVLESEREANSTQLQHHLSELFGELAEEETRQQEELQQFCDELDRKVSQFIDDRRNSRQKEAEKLAKELALFSRSLAENTRFSVGEMGRKRQLQWLKLSQELQYFRTQFECDRPSANGRSFDEDSDVKQQTRDRLEEDLNEFVEILRSDIENRLQQLEQLQAERLRGIEEVLNKMEYNRRKAFYKLRDRLLEFARELLSYPGQVYSSVGSPPSVSIRPTNRKIPASLESDVYGYIHQQKGARLADIESALGMERIQTVQVLRSLLVQGIIIQRDRVYYTQEEMSQ